MCMKMKGVSDRFCSILLSAVFLLAWVLSSCSKDPLDIPERCTGDSYGELHSPMVKNEKAKEHQTRWSCLYYGSYPTNEVVDGLFDAVDDYALAQGDVIVDATLFALLQKADWDENGDTVLEGKRYHRLGSDDAVTASGDHHQHYRWKDLKAWHYFAYEPIQWRVLNIKGEKALLLAHRMPDNCPYHDTPEDVTWSESYMRQWLNTTFLERAFSPSERMSIEETDIENVNNYYFGTSCGPTTRDCVFVLSESEAFSSDKAVDYGFYPGDGFTDPARRFRSTLYAKCRGSWWSPNDNEAPGGSFWFLRTSGYTNANAVYVGAEGDIYNRGMVNTCNDAAVLPAIILDLSQAKYQTAPEVTSSL